MTKQIESVYPASDAFPHDIVLDGIALDDVTHTSGKSQPKKEQKRTKSPSTISTNGASHPSHVGSNGAGISKEISDEEINDRANGFHAEQQFYYVDGQKIDISNISYEDIITEDDEPVDNFPSEKQQRLLVNPLYSSSHLPKPFVAAANVGVHYLPKTPAIVPDMFLSLNTKTVDGHEIWDKKNRTYYVWNMGKPPEVVIEIVSNRKGNEGDQKFDKYTTVGAKYYVVLDHLKHAQDEILKVYELVDGHYEARDDFQLPDVNLSLQFWENTFEGMAWSWIRWCDLEGNMIPLAEERADNAEERADSAEERADQEKARADQALENLDKATSESAKIKAEVERERQEKNRIQAQVERERQEKAKIQAEADRRIERALAELRAAGIEVEI